MHLSMCLSPIDLKRELNMYLKVSIHVSALLKRCLRPSLNPNPELQPKHSPGLNITSLKNGNSTQYKGAILDRNIFIKVGIFKEPEGLSTWQFSVQ